MFTVQCSKMGIPNLPLELIYQIVEYLDFERDINALAQINKRLYSALNSYLYRHHVEEWDATAFEYACKSGFSNAMRMFLDEGMSIHTYDYGWTCDDGFSPVNLAAMYGREDIVKYLLEKGVDPNVKQHPMQNSGEIRTQFGDVGPFDLAIEKGHEGTARLLVPHMKIVDGIAGGKNHVRKTLTWAARHGHLNLVKMLVEELKFKVEPTRDQEDWKGVLTTTPLAYAAEMGHTDIVRYLLSAGADPNVTIGAFRETPLGNAVIHNHLETAKTLIEHGSDPDPIIMIQQAKSTFRDEADQDTYNEVYQRIIFPLTNAVSHGYQEMLKLLFEHIDLGRTFECDLEDINFLVPAAAACGLEGIVQRLLEKGCDVNALFSIFKSNRLANVGNALSLASSNGHISVARILLGHGADPNAPDARFHLKPLIAAVNAGHQQVVELLLDAGAIPNTRDHSGNPILILAVQSGPILRMFLNRGIDPSALGHSERERSLEIVMRSRDVSAMRTLLSTKFELPIFDEDNSSRYITLLAAKNASGTAMFEYMMEYLWHQCGVKPSPQDFSSRSCLSLAIKSRNAEAVEVLLVRYGLKLENGVVLECLAWAAYWHEGNCMKWENTLDVLLRHGTDINATIYDYHTCLSLLVCRRIQHCAKLLLTRGAKYPLEYKSFGTYLLSLATRYVDARLLELMLRSIDAQGISLEDIEPHLRQAEVDIPVDCDKVARLRLMRLLQYFRCRRMYPVSEAE